MYCKLRKFISETKRIYVTTRCHDCDYILKVANAGNIICEKGVKCIIMHNGIRILTDCYGGKWQTRIIHHLRGHHEPQEEKVFHEVLKSIPADSVMIELGSHWAYYSLWFNCLVQGAKNYLIEPNLRKLEIGKKNFQLNSRKGFFCHAFIGRSSKENSIFRDWNGVKTIVNQISVDDFIDKNNLQFVSVLHSDIQGAEYEMLLGCEKSIKSGKIGYIFLSTHDDNHDRCLKRLVSNSYTIIAQHSIPESYSVDGLIVARLSSVNGPIDVDVSRRCRLFRASNKMTAC